MVLTPVVYCAHNGGGVLPSLPGHCHCHTENEEKIIKVSAMTMLLFLLFLLLKRAREVKE